MLSSIHPLGERARDNRWGLTVSAFTMGALISGSAVGAASGAVGSLVSAVDTSMLLIAIAVVALTAGALDLAGINAPGPKRQVNENWIGAFRGWVYGGGFGLELGSGFVTYIVTWGVYATFAAALLTTTPLAGALVGATFGFGRSISLLVAGFVDRPSRLTSFNRTLARIGPSVRRSSAVAFTLLGLVVLGGGLL